MFSISKKIDVNLKQILTNGNNKYYRVIILCKNLTKETTNKIKSFDGTVLNIIDSINCISAIINTKAIKRLAEYPSVEYIICDEYCLLCASSITNANNISIKKKFMLSGKRIGIGVIDSGVYPHSDLLNPNNKIKDFKDFINNINYPYDDNGHGTFISGILSSSGYLSKGEYEGLAKDSNIYMVKSFDNAGRGFISDILTGLDYLISKDDNIKIILLPFETLRNDFITLNLFSSLFSLAVNKGITIIVPSGHNGNHEDSIRGIATLNNCITVGGVDTSSNTIKPFSLSSGGDNKIVKPDLVAPCSCILSLNSNTSYISQRNGIKIYPSPLDKPYTIYSGTSIAAAFVASLCALLYEYNNDYTFKDISSLLKISCTPLKYPSYLQGEGMIDINKLLP
ncbi:MAG: S8 family serine peptidase [Clostridiaceae bacterium]